MRRIKEGLRLKEGLGVSDTAVSRSVRIARSTVKEYLDRAAAVGLNWEAVAELSEEELDRRLFAAVDTRHWDRPLPDWEAVEKELRGRGVTLRLLWLGYLRRHPEGYPYTQFCAHFHAWQRPPRPPPMRRQHRAGEALEVDYAGMTQSVIDKDVVRQAQVFVACLPCSDAAIAASIKEWGWTTPALVGEDGGLIAGHARILAARQLGIAEIPVMVAAGWSEAQKRAYVLADNQLAITGSGWDPELLRLELGELKLSGFDLSLTGFGDLELKDLLAERTAGLTDPDDAPAAPEHPVSQTGDLWLLGRHRLLCGDSTVATDVQRVLGGVAPHLMVTDPPYGVNYDPAWRNQAGRSINGTTQPAAAPTHWSFGQLCSLASPGNSPASYFRETQ